MAQRSSPCHSESLDTPWQMAMIPAGRGEAATTHPCRSESLDTPWQIAMIPAGRGEAATTGNHLILLMWTDCTMPNMAKYTSRLDPP